MKDTKFKFLIDDKIITASYTLNDIMSKGITEEDILCSIEDCSCSLNESCNHCECSPKYENSTITRRLLFSGLKDIDGVEIYDGAILEEDRLGIKLFYKVWLSSGGFVINQFQDDYKKDIEKINFYSPLADMQNKGWLINLKVVGNHYIKE